MSWHQGALLGFDTESTGIDVWTDRIVTTALVDITPGQRPTVATELVNPGIDIPAEATEVHGITTEHAAAHGRPPEQVLFEVTGKLALAMTRGVPIVAANAPYDFTLLDTENRRHGLPTLADRLPGGRYGPIVDVMVLDKHYDPYRKAICAEAKNPCDCGAVSKKLVDLCKHYRAPFSADGAHDAGADALAACRLVPRLVEKYPELADMLPAHLHALQIRWRKEQMASLRSYFNRIGTEHDGCDGGWPLRTDQPQAVAS
jgi:DNA polymerase-3 subunit epsilon